MRMSFTGIEGNAMRSVGVLEAVIQNSADSEEEADELLTELGTIKTCISAYRDTILALLKGDATIAEAKDFWFHGEDISKVPYRGGVLKITPKENVT